MSSNNCIESTSIQWHISEAIVTISLIDQEVRKVGFHCGLAGGVLTRGWSSHDLDVMIMPMNLDEQDPRRPIQTMRDLREALLRVLPLTVLGIPKIIREYSHEYLEVRYVASRLLIYERGQKRIDFFVYDH